MAAPKSPPIPPGSARAARTAVLTISDSCARGARQDLSGPAVVKMLSAHDFLVADTQILPDDRRVIEAALVAYCGNIDFVVTTGGTGISATDVTPEATRSVCDRILDGVSEQMRREGSKSTRFALLSRGLCGARGRTLILNLPGSPRGATESLAAVLDLVPHALELLRGVDRHE